MNPPELNHDVQLAEIAALLRAQLKIQRMLVTIIGKGNNIEQPVLDDIDETVMRHFHEEVDKAVDWHLNHKD